MSDKPKYVYGFYNEQSAAAIARHGIDMFWWGGLCNSLIRKLPDKQLILLPDMLADFEKVRRISPNAQVWFDCDTGPRDLAELTREFSLAGVAGACVEDQQSDLKGNSLALDGKHVLEDKIVYNRKIFNMFNMRAEASKKSNLNIIARMESLICGHSVDVALERSAAAKDVGADIIVIHENRPEPTRVFEFLKRWNKQLPVAVIPTAYDLGPHDELKDMGVDYVVLANQTYRAVLKTPNDAEGALNRVLEASPEDLIGPNPRFQQQGGMVPHQQLLKISEAYEAAMLRSATAPNELIHG